MCYWKGLLVSVLIFPLVCMANSMHEYIALQAHRATYSLVDKKLPRVVIDVPSLSHLYRFSAAANQAVVPLSAQEFVQLTKSAAHQGGYLDAFLNAVTGSGSKLKQWKDVHLGLLMAKRNPQDGGMLLLLKPIGNAYSRESELTLANVYLRIDAKPST